jgi:hypothetical protein
LAEHIEGPLYYERMGPGAARPASLCDGALSKSSVPAQAERLAKSSAAPNSDWWRTAEGIAQMRALRP